eukprot:3177778-Pyramimonas_sp.AAC.1
MPVLARVASLSGPSRQGEDPFAEFIAQALQRPPPAATPRGNQESQTSAGWKHRDACSFLPLGWS